MSKGRLFTMGNPDGHDTVYCFDAGLGRELWKFSYLCGLRPQFYEGGTSSTPTVDGDRVYTLSKEGHLFCFSVDNGQVLWQKHMVQDLGATLPRWCFAGSPLVLGDLLILNVGPAGTALDKRTGEVRWFSGKGPTGYATPVPVSLGERQGILIFSAKALVCVDAKTGREFWRFRWVTHWDLNIVDPIVSGDQVFISSFDQGGALLKVNAGGVRQLWRNKNLGNHFSTSVLFNGFLFGFDGNTDKPPAELRCLSFKTGELKWRHRGLGFGALIVADGKLIIISEKGELVVARAVARDFEPVARAQVLGGKCWITPVLANARIYCRNAKGTLVCLDVRGR